MLTPQDMAIASARAEGCILQKIANDNGIDVSTVSRHAQKPDVKALIERINKKVVDEAAEESANNIIHAVKQYRRNPTVQSLNNKGEVIQLPDTQLRDHGFKASNTVLQAMGIFPTHSPSQMIINIMQAGNTYISPIVTELLSKIMPIQAQVPALGLGVIDVQAEPANHSDIGVDMGVCNDSLK